MYGRRMFWLLVFLCQAYLGFCTEWRALNKFIHRYEPLNYAEDEVRSSYQNGEEVKSLNFKAFGRNFDLRLKQDKDTFYPNMEGIAKDVKDSLHNTVVGHLEGEPNSEVFGSVNNGKFEGTIFVGGDEFSVKPAERYFDKPQEFHSVIYNAEDVDNPNRKRNAEEVFSKASDTHRAKRRRRESSEYDTPEKFKLYDQIKNKNLKICNISMEADYLFTMEMGNDTGRAVGEMIYLVRVANRKFDDISKTKEWGNTFKVRLMIGRIMAYTYDTTPRELRPRNMGVSTFLDYVSDRNYDGYCQAFFFTYRDFEGGITGLTWGNDRQYGICTARRYFIRIYENFNVQKSKSYNSGVITYKFYGSLVPPKVAEIAFLRQVGTAFGAMDDPPTKECQPGAPDGNYIMFDKATNAGRSNNNKYSPCSIRDIVKTLKSDKVRRLMTKDRYPEIFCLELPEAIIERRPRCGDSIAHNNEQCDCGTEEECKIKEPGRCCNPKTCTLRKGASCSVNDGPCCDTTTCSHRSAAYVCRKGDECAFASKCNNLRGFDNYVCPARVKKGDFKPCAWESQVCMDGVCSNSVCRRYGLTECQCTRKEHQCHVCCHFLNKCVAALLIPVVTGFRNPTLPIGAPCANDTGYCDLFHLCQVVDIKTPFEKIEDIYYKREDVRTITRKYWWAILLGTAFWISLIVLIVYCVNKRTSSSIPKRDTRGMQMNLLQSSTYASSK